MFKEDATMQIALASSGGRAFMTTPLACSRSGGWISRLKITYEDGTVRSNQRYAMREVRSFRSPPTALMPNDRTRAGLEQVAKRRWSR
jgi:hypothetical protein